MGAEERTSQPLGTTFLKSLVCVEAAVFLFATGVVGFFFVGTLVGVGGARASIFRPRRWRVRSSS